MACSCKGSECKHSAFNAGKSKSMKSVKISPKGGSVTPVGKRGGRSAGKR